MKETPLPPCSVLLLAGGRGARLGGRDKGLVEWQGQPMIAWLHARVRGLTDDLIISCNRNHAQYAPWADRLVSDDSDDFPGPLAGIRAGLAAARHPVLLVLPCDAPCVDESLLQALRRRQTEYPAQCVMARRGEQWEPLFAVIPHTARQTLENAWQNGERSPRRVMADIGCQPLDLPAADPRLANLNDPESLMRTTRRGMQRNGI